MGTTVNLPFGWIEVERDNDTHLQSGWIRPHRTFLSFEDSEVLDRQWNFLNSLSPQQWHKIYGVATPQDKIENPAFADFGKYGIECGSLKTSPASDIVAIGCVSFDKKKTFEFTGQKRDLKGAASIMQQVLGEPRHP